MFRITGSKGFQMVFDNGNTVSVQFGYGNYCENRNDYSARVDFHTGKAPDMVECETAEVAAWASKEGCSSRSGKWYNFGTDQVAGYLTADEVMSFIHFVATSDLSRDRWDSPHYPADGKHLFDLYLAAYLPKPIEIPEALQSGGA